jgi:mono/diheme cytochrome c family protein
MRHFILASLWATFASLGAFATPAAAPAELASRVSKVLSQNCYACHANGAAKGGFGVAHNLAALRASPYVDLAHPEKSLIVDLVEKGEMPPFGPKLTPEQTRDLLEWIRAGAPAK